MLPRISGTISLAAAIPLRRHDDQPERRKAHRPTIITGIRSRSSVLRSQGFASLLALAVTRSVPPFASLPVPSGLVSEAPNTSPTRRDYCLSTPSSILTPTPLPVVLKRHAQFVTKGLRSLPCWPGALPFRESAPALH